MNGFASPTGTNRYRERFPELHSKYWRTLGTTNLTVSAYGFGGYRVHYSEESHHRALRHALLNGCNLIDTSSNYGDGGSEILIGQTCKALIGNGILHRDEVCIVSKVGYMQGSNLGLAKDREAAGRPFPETVHYMEGCWHCIHPEFLEDQLQRSLHRLGMDAIDVYLLHNPEYFLTLAKKTKENREEAHREYYRRIENAFRWMEEKVSEGRIGSYGISSNTFPNADDDFEFTSLEHVLEIAQRISKIHRFTTIQFPMNLLERGAWCERNQHRSNSNLLEVAKEAQLGVLLNRPLNAFGRGELVRLSSFTPRDLSELFRAIDASTQRLNELEDRFHEIVSEIPALAELQPDQLNSILWGGILAQQYRQFTSFEHWNSALESMIWPSFLNAVHFFNKHIDDRDDWQKWIREYSKELMSFLKTISAYFETLAQNRSEQIARKLSELNANLASLPTLSQKAVHLLASFPEVTSVLIGMRKPEYVDDILALAKHPPTIDAHDVFETIHQQSLIENALSETM